MSGSANEEEVPGWPGETASLDDEVTRRRLLAAIGAATAGGLALAADDVQAAARVVGVDATDRRAIEFVGQMNQDGTTLTTFGYLTHLQGASDGALFTRPRGVHFTDPRSADESAARLTLFSVTRLLSVNRIAHHLSVAASGGVAIHLQPGGGARLADPGSFARGTKVATFSGRFQNKLVLFDGGQFPGQWATAGLTGDLVQQSATGFSIGGRSVKLGKKGLRWAIDAVGEGHLDEPTRPRSHIDFLGNMSVQDAARR